MAKNKVQTKIPMCGHTSLTSSCSQCVKFQEQWYRAAEKNSSFKDIEDSKENLAQYDRRTIAFDNRIVIQEFHLKLNSYLTNTSDIPKKHRQVLELYSNGVPIQSKKLKPNITQKTKIPVRTINWILKKYRDLLN